MNLSGVAVAEYRLDLERSDLEFGDARLVYGAGDQLAMPRVNAAGGFEAYQPLPMLAAHSLLVIAF